MTAEIDKIFLECHSTKLSLAVSLLDDYSKGKPIGRVEVSLKGRKEKTVKNLSSYYLFLDLPDDTYTVQVRSDYYFDEDSDTINLAELGSNKPVINLTLKPDPSYPFPPGTTLIRGVVKNTGIVAHAGITAKIMTPKENKSTEIVEMYLFTWDNVPGNDSERLIGFLRDDLDVDWAENGVIHKSDDGKTISIVGDENSAEIAIGENNEKATLKISDGRIYFLKVKHENGKLKIYVEDIFAGFSSIGLADIADINKDDAYMIKNSTKTRIEFCRITDIPADPTNNPFKLEKPLRFEHAGETPLHEMAEERTLDVKHTEKGEFVVYFSMIKSYKTLVDLEISYLDHTKETIRDIEVEEGKTTSLGKMIK